MLHHTFALDKPSFRQDTSMEIEDRLGLMKRSKLAGKVERVKEMWEEFEPLVAKEEERVNSKQEFVYEEEDSKGESEMVVCVRVRPRLEHEVASGAMVTTSASNPQVARWKVSPMPRLSASSLLSTLAPSQGSPRTPSRWILPLEPRMTMTPSTRLWLLLL